MQHLHLVDGAVVEYEQRSASSDGVSREVVVIFGASSQPGLVSMQLDQPISSRLRVSEWSPAVRSKLQNLDVCFYPALDELIEAIGLLPNLRRLHYQMGGPYAEEFAALAHALASSQVEALYLSA